MAAPPEITQEHVDLAMGLARRQAGGGHLADELEAEAMVILWELALSYDASSGVPFGAYVGTFLPRRLVDWHRKAYGRATNGVPDARLNFNRQMISIEHYNDQLEPLSESLVDPAAPSLEEIVEDREDLATAMAVINELPRGPRLAMLWPAFDAAPTELFERYGYDRHSAGLLRAWTKMRVAQQLTTGEPYKPPVTARQCECGRLYGRTVRGRWPTRCLECMVIRRRAQKAADNRRRYVEDPEVRDRIREAGAERYWADPEAARAWHREHYRTVRKPRREKARTVTDASLRA